MMRNKTVNNVKIQKNSKEKAHKYRNQSQEIGSSKKRQFLNVDMKLFPLKHFLTGMNNFFILKKSTDTLS